MHAATVPVPPFAEPTARRAAGVWLAPIAIAFSFSLGGAAEAGKITVTTQPAGATIYIDGQASGKAPAQIEGLGPGRYFVRVELDGYRAGEAVVEVSSGQNAPALTLNLLSNSIPHPAEPLPAPAATPRSAPPAPQPVSTPVPVAPPRATPAPTPAPPPVAPAVAPDAATDSDEAILTLVNAQLKAITDGDIDAYLRLCAAKVDLYDEGVQSREAIRRSRQKLKERWPVYEISNIRDLAVRAAEQPGVKRAAVTYDWNVSNPKTGKKASGTASDLLDFKQIDGQWLIVKARQNVDRKKKSSGQ
jgi:hypothetical protein